MPARVYLKGKGTKGAGVDGVQADLLISLPIPTLLIVGTRRLQLPAECVAEREKAKDGQHAEQDGHRLAQADSAGNRRPSQHGGSKKTQLDTVRLAVLDLVTAEAVWMPSLAI